MRIFINRCKNLLLKGALFLGNLGVKKEKFQEKNPRFLIVSTTGLGDTIWALPAIEHLKKSFSHVYIGALVTPLSHQILLNNSALDEFFVLKKPFLFHAFSLISQLRKKKIQVVYIFHTSQRILLPICAAIKASIIIGTEKQHKGLDDFLTIKVPKKIEHEILRRLRIVQQVTLDMPKISVPKYYLTSQEKTVGKDLASNMQKPIIIIHPGAKDRYKTWPKEFFVQAMRKIANKTSCTFIITGTKKEEPLIHYLMQNFTSAKRFIDLPFRKFAALISVADMLISNDTGPIHLSSSLNIPTIALFSPTDPENYALPSNAIKIIYKKPLCTPCYKRNCKDPTCMQQISPQEVADAVLQKLSLII